MDSVFRIEKRREQRIKFAFAFAFVQCTSTITYFGRVAGRDVRAAADGPVRTVVRTTHRRYHGDTRTRLGLW